MARSPHRHLALDRRHIPHRTVRKLDILHRITRRAIVAKIVPHAQLILRAINGQI